MSQLPLILDAGASSMTEYYYSAVLPKIEHNAAMSNTSTSSRHQNSRVRTNPLLHARFQVRRAILYSDSLPTLSLVSTRAALWDIMGFKADMTEGCGPGELAAEVRERLHIGTAAFVQLPRQAPVVVGDELRVASVPILLTPCMSRQASRRLGYVPRSTKVVVVLTLQCRTHIVKGSN